MAVEDVDGERPKPPSPRFPVWKPRYLDGGVFPLNARRCSGTNPKGKLTCQRGAKMPSEARLSGCLFLSVWRFFLAEWFIGYDRAGSGGSPPPFAAVT